jgi:hypothetical protein
MKTTSITAKIPTEMHSDLERVSIEANVPLSSVIRWAISDFLYPSKLRVVKIEVEKP